MSIVWSFTARRLVLSRLIPYFNTCNLRLFTAPAILTPALLSGNMTEPTFDGYTPKPLKSWSSAFLNVNRQGEVDEQAHVWTVGPLGGADTILGYWVADPSGYLVWSELDPAGPTMMTAPGDTYSVLPRLMSGELA